MNKNLALAVITSIGVVVTAVLAAHGGKDAQILKEKVDRQCSEVIPRKAKEMHWSEEVTSEVLKELRRGEKRERIKMFLPAAVSAGITVFLIASRYRISKRQISALGAFGAAETKRLRKYRKAAKEVFGDDADQKIIAEVAEEDWGAFPKIMADDQNPKKELFYDAFADRLFYATTSRVREAIYHLNRNFTLRQYAAVNEFYDFIGIGELTDIGDFVGWYADWFWDNGYEGPWIDVFIGEEHFKDGTKYYSLRFSVEPMTEKEFEESCG